MLLSLIVAPLLLAAQLPVPVLGKGGSLIDKPGHGGKVAPPSDAKPTGPVAPTMPSGSAGHAAAGPAAPSGASAPPEARPAVMYATGGADLEAITGGEEVEDWWIWWELHKSLYLVSPDDPPPSSALPWRLQTTMPETPGQQHARLAATLLPLLRAALADPAAPVRVAAATSLGRLGGDAAFDALLPLLHDSSLDVREAALLALGATGCSRAAATLLGVASDGHVAGDQKEISPSAEPIALVALGMARLHGLDDRVDGLVTSLVQDAGSEVREAGLLYDALARTQTCAGLVQRLATDDSLDIRLRCRITEALPSFDASLLPAAMAELVADNVDRRRAAAVTLAGVRSGTVLTELEAALTKEKEPLTRGLLLLSVGAHGSDASRELLQRQLVHGRAPDRPWVALALGLLARAGNDDAARVTLRQGLAEESSAAARGAWLLALGLSRDPLALPALREAVTDDVDPRNRMFAALALSMLRDEDALSALRAALPHERSDLARSGLLLGVALFRRSEDAPRLLAELHTANNPLLQSQLASALGLNDTAAAAQGLHDLVLGPDKLPDAARAAALDAIGLLLDDHAGLQLVHTATGRNFAVFPDWLARALVATSL